MKQMFVTNEYRVLEFLYNNSVCVNGVNFCAINQYEVAKELQLSRANINKIFSNLQSIEYISMIARGRWRISNEAIKMIRLTKNL